MGDHRIPDPSKRADLTPRQRQWFAAIRASLEPETGKSLEEWVAIARTCPETAPRARQTWLKIHYGLGANRAAYVLDAAFPPAMGWGEPDQLRAALWTDPAAAAILQAVEQAATALPDVIIGQRKAFTAFSRAFQFAAIRPAKGGYAILGLAVTADADPRLEPPRNEGWSERLKAKTMLTAPDQVDAGLIALLQAAWETS
jgi:hypothetical protein